jgi:hypothetical protein
MARGIKTWTDLMKEVRFDSSIVEGLTKHVRSRDEQEREAYTGGLGIKHQQNMSGRPCTKQVPFSGESAPAVERLAVPDIVVMVW